MTGLKWRPATNEEILREYRYTRANYRHFVKEIYNPRARKGVSHRQYTRAKVHNVDGVPHVRYDGELVPVRATYYTLGERGFVSHVEIDNPYLPPRRDY